MSDYKKYNLYRAGEYVGYVAIYKRDHEFIRALFERAHGVIRPFISHFVSLHEPHDDDTCRDRPESDYLAHFEIEAAQEDVHLMTGVNADGSSNE